MTNVMHLLLHQEYQYVFVKLIPFLRNNLEVSFLIFVFFFFFNFHHLLCHYKSQETISLRFTFQGDDMDL